jgi:hypothetical protein
MLLGSVLTGLVGLGLLALLIYFPVRFFILIGQGKSLERRVKALTDRTLADPAQSAVPPCRRSPQSRQCRGMWRRRWRPQFLPNPRMSLVGSGRCRPAENRFVREDFILPKRKGTWRSAFCGDSKPVSRPGGGA